MEETINKFPLVSIVVVSYNSAEYIISTLHSVFIQTYQNIELIISDDCSQDNTIEKCEKWIREHGNRFERTKILTSAVNTGVVENNNRAFKEANGDWIKCIAGDDLLLPTCIEHFIDYIKKTDSVNVCFANSVSKTTEQIRCIDYATLETATDKLHQYAKMTAKEQLYSVFKFWLPPPATLFVKRNFIESLGYFDVRYPFMEDLPFIVKCLMNNVKLHFIDNNVAIYRNDSGVCANVFTSSGKNYFQSRKAYFEGYLLELYPQRLILYKWHVKVMLYQEKIKIRNNVSRLSLIYRIFFCLIDPIRFIHLVKRVLK